VSSARVNHGRRDRAGRAEFVTRRLGQDHPFDPGASYLARETMKEPGGRLRSRAALYAA
jgi:hypothetical protein